MAGKVSQTLDINKVLTNAVHSIKLGVEDYQLSTSANGNPIRAISAARNLFAGVLLLFKYKIATLARSSEHAASLIYKPHKFKPHTTAEGAIEWKPEFERNNTIDTATIEQYFNGLGISTDWAIVRSLQRCRNDLEHLHPKHPVEDINKFLLDLFPLLMDFITNEIEENPATLLGETWEVMLQNHAFFRRNFDEAWAKWRALGLLDVTLDLFKTCQCANCGSPLLEPHRDDIQEGWRYDDPEFRYRCIACNNSDSLIKLLEDELKLAKENPFDEEPVIVECDACGHIMFDLQDGSCHLCAYQYRVPRCSGCDHLLEGYEAENGTLCDRCAEYAHYNDEYEPHIR